MVDSCFSEDRVSFNCDSETPRLQTAGERLNVFCCPSEQWDCGALNSFYLVHGGATVAIEREASRTRRVVEGQDYVLVHVIRPEFL